MRLNPWEICPGETARSLERLLVSNAFLSDPSIDHFLKYDVVHTLRGNLCEAEAADFSLLEEN
jgi:hypothetical protein